MGTKDLMIGNWVYYTKKSQFPMRVVSLGEDYVYLDFEENEGDVFEPNLEDMQPIEVTEEFILKNGFEKKEYNVSGYSSTSIHYMKFGNVIFDINRFSNSIGRNWHCHIENSDCDSIGSFDFQYVHEFQNGIRLITGKDMEVKL